MYLCKSLWSPSSPKSLWTRRVFLHTVVPSDDKQRVLQLDQLRRSVSVQYEGQKLLRYFFCIGHALSLPMLDPNVGKLSVQHNSVSSLRRLCEKSHLTLMRKKAKTQRNQSLAPVCICKGSFKSMMDFRNHTELVHGVIIR